MLDCWCEGDYIESHNEFGETVLICCECGAIYYVEGRD